MADEKSTIDTISGVEGEDTLIGFLTSKFNSYKEGRKRIEGEWRQDYNAYLELYEKEWKEGEGVGWRSKVYFPMTRTKINVGKAQISDIWFRGGKFPFGISNSPLPDSANEGMEALGFDLDERKENMRLLIEDQFVETKAKDHLLSILDSATIFGSGVMRGPMIGSAKRNRYVAKIKKGSLPALPPDGEGDAANTARATAKEIAAEKVEFKLEEFTETVPKLESPDIWDFFPDPESDGDTQTMNGMFLRQYLTRAEFHALGELKDSKDQPVYDQTHIDEILKDSDTIDEKDDSFGPHRDRKEEMVREKRIEVFEYAGVVSKADLSEHLELAEDIKDVDPIEVIITFSREKVLRVIENPFPAKKRPYNMVQWERLPGSPWGRGIARALRNPQSVMNGLLRAYLDNKNLASALMTAIDEGALQEGSDLSLRPGKNWRFRDGTDVNKAFQAITLPDITAGMMEAMQRTEEWGDTASGIPKVLEGEQISGPRETAFEVNERVKSAAKQFGLVIRYFDERIIEPVTEAFYDWNMEFSKRKDIQGDFKIVATGFQTFQNHTLKGIAVRNLYATLLESPPEVAVKWNLDKMVKDIALFDELDPKEYLKPEKQLLAEEEQAQQAQQAAQEAQQAAADAEAAESQAERDMKLNMNKTGNDAKVLTTAMSEETKREVSNAQLANAPPPERNSDGGK